MRSPTPKPRKASTNWPLPPALVIGLIPIGLLAALGLNTLLRSGAETLLTLVMAGVVLLMIVVALTPEKRGDHVPQSDDKPVKPRLDRWA